ncbi:hypothetical protein [Salmonirosea aquatica]|uniref:Uncharacterized protein n=1 Tax=Salmonirosea aquatica TaxID=2654236 RepID=A0A7C9BI80_9BACT|nr:hypothetical protein [Cytophagaceae bacterium SJW1-29]
MTHKISTDDCLRDLGLFIREKKGDEHIPKDLPDIRKHFKSWMRIHYQVKETSKLNNTPHANNQQPFPRTGRTLRPTSRAHSEYLGKGSTCDVELRASRTA